MMTIYPIWIQPLFNKLDPLPAGVLREASAPRRVVVLLCLCW